MVRLLTVAVLALLPAVAHAAAPKLVDSATVPGSASDASPIPLGAVLEADEPYRLVVSGVVNLWPGNATGKPYSADAVWCFDVPGYCDTPTYNGTLKWLAYEGDAYRSSTIMGQSAYNTDHVYEEDISFPYDARLRLATSDTSPNDNTGSLTVQLFKLPTREFRFFAVSCRDKKRYTDLSLPNRGCQSARLVALGPNGPDGARINVQVRRGKRWEGLPTTCGAGLPPARCQIIVRGDNGGKERYRALLIDASDAVIATRRVSINFLD